MVKEILAKLGAGGAATEVEEWMIEVGESATGAGGAADDDGAGAACGDDDDEWG